MWRGLQTTLFRQLGQSKGCHLLVRPARVREGWLLRGLPPSPPLLRSPYSHILQGKTQTPASPAGEPRMCVGAQRPRAPCAVLLFLGLVLGATAKPNCVGNTYPSGNKCCHECQPGEWPGHGVGKGYLWRHGDGDRPVGKEGVWVS